MAFYTTDDDWQNRFYQEDPTLRTALDRVINYDDDEYEIVDLFDELEEVTRGY